MCSAFFLFLIGGFRYVLCVSVFRGSLIAIVIMISGSEKRNCEGGFELQPPLVFEKRSNPPEREFSVLLNIPRSR